jgi:hypothetical protein
LPALNNGCSFLFSAALPTGLAMLLGRAASHVPATPVVAATVPAVAAVSTAAVRRLATLSPDFSHVLSISAYGFAAFSTDLCHVLTIPAHGFTTLTGDFALLLRVHRCEPSRALAAAVASAISHRMPPLPISM